MPCPKKDDVVGNNYPVLTTAENLSVFVPDSTAMVLFYKYFFGSDAKNNFAVLPAVYLGLIA